jgi:hypothetical protein
MNKTQEERLPYEKPELNIEEFTLQDSIATSGDYGFGAICTE